MVVRQGFPFRLRLGLEVAVKYGAESSMTIDRLISVHKYDALQTSSHEVFFSSLTART